MKKILIFLTLLLFISTKIIAFENAQLNLAIPNVLNENEASLGIRYRFFGNVKKVDRVFGSDNGGDISFLLKYALLNRLLLSINHTRNQVGYDVGLEYAQNLSIIGSIGLGVNIYTIKDFNFKDRQKSFLINSTYQSPALFNHLIFTSNFGYDKY